MLIALGTLALRYPRFVEDQISRIGEHIILKSAETAGESAVRGFGLILFLAYIITPLSLLLIYFAIEGAVRLIGAVATGEIVGTLPFTLADISLRRWNTHHAEKKLGPRVPDIVSVPPVDGSGYHLSIASCREKQGWDHLITISYGDTLYEVADYIEGSAPHKFVYLLRHAPAHKVVRGLHHYDPEEVMERK